MNMSDELRARFDAMQKQAFLAGAIGLALLAAGALFNPTQFFRSYLVAFIFWIGVALGCLAICMLHHLTGGAWGIGIRRMLEAGARTFPLLLILFLPLLFGLARLYVWAQPEAVSADKILQYKRLYLNVPSFIVRAAIYFAVWNLLAFLLSRWSAEQDATANPSLAGRLEALSGPGLIFSGFAATFSAIDWVMSLEPHWFSTIYGMMFMVSEALAALSLVIILGMLFSDMPPLSEVMGPGQFHDLGNLLFAFTMLWAYLSFSQYLLVWAANLREEVPWYTSRATGGWAGVALLLIVLHFAVPFLLLLSTDIKRRKRRVAGVAAGLLVMCFVDTFWIITPAFHPDGPSLHWMDLIAAIGVGGIWLAAMLAQWKKRSLVPLHDPGFESASLNSAHLEGAHGHGD